MIGAGLFLLAMAVVYLVSDLFFSSPEPSVNPWELDTSALKAGDTVPSSHREMLNFKPAMTMITALAVDSLDRILVGGSGGIEVFGAGGNPVFRVATGDTVLCITIHRNGNMILGFHDHLQIRSARGDLIRNLPLPDQRCVVTSLASSGEFIFAADAGNRIVYRMDMDGRLLNRIGSRDPALGIPGFIVPSNYFDLLARKDGTVWVVNPGRHALEHYQPDGTLIGRWEKKDEGPDGFFGCCNPGHIAMLHDGSLVTAEKGIVRIKRYTLQGEMISLVAGPSSFDENTRGMDLAVDSHDRIVVLDPARRQVRVFVISE